MTLTRGLTIVVMGSSCGAGLGLVHYVSGSRVSPEALAIEAISEFQMQAGFALLGLGGGLWISCAVVTGCVIRAVYDPARDFLIRLHLLLIALTGSIAIGGLVSLNCLLLLMFGWLAVCSFTAPAWRYGWFVPCTVVGALGGIFGGAPSIHHTLVDSWSWITWSVLAGIALGLALDAQPDSEIRPEDQSGTKLAPHR